MAKRIPRLNIQVNIETTDYEIRIEEIRDSTYWVVPVVMMVEGVHHGSRGALLYTEEELAASVRAWDGMPITIGHPQNDKGKYISANSPSVLKGITGRIYNAKMKGGKLTAEAWIDMGALVQISADAVEYIKEKKALDVSVGVFSEEEGPEGEWNGEQYRAIATNLIPDHLALLPGQDGACNWNDGCGIRNNIKHDMERKDKTKLPQWLDKKVALKTFLEINEGLDLVENKDSLNQIVSSVYDKLNAMDSDHQVHYLEEVFDNYMVYSVINRDGQGRERKMFKQEYSFSDGKVEFTGNPVEVRKKVTFVNANEKMKRINNNESKMKTNKKCTCTVDSLIQNKATKFTEDDREWLAALSDEQLQKLAPEEEAPAPPPAKPAPTGNAGATEKKDAPVVEVDDKGALSINGKSMAQIIKDVLANESDPTKFIDTFMPEGLKNQMKSGLAMYQNQRTNQIKEIVANSKFKKEQLEKFSDEDLAALHASLVPEKEEVGGNYAAFGGTGTSESEEEEDIDEIAAMIGFEKPEPKKTDKAA